MPEVYDPRLLEVVRKRLGTLGVIAGPWMSEDGQIVDDGEFVYVYETVVVSDEVGVVVFRVNGSRPRWFYRFVLGDSLSQPLGEVTGDLSARYEPVRVVVETIAPNAWRVAFGHDKKLLLKVRPWGLPWILRAQSGIRLDEVSEVYKVKGGFAAGNPCWGCRGNDDSCTDSSWRVYNPASRLWEDSGKPAVLEVIAD